MNFCLDDGNRLEEKTVEYELSPTLEMVENVTELLIPSGIRIVQREIRKKIKNTSWSIQYPQLQGIKSQYLQSRINNYLRKQFAKELVEQSEQINNPYYIENDEDYDEREASVDSNYEICLLSDELFSVQLFSSDYSARAAYPNNYFESINIDLSSGYRLTYNDLFRLESDYRTRIPELISISLDSEFNENWKERDEYELTLHRDYMEVINIFDIHAIQAVTAKIKYSDVIDIIHPESPLGKYLSVK